MELYENSEAMIGGMERSAERGAGDRFNPPYPYTMDKLEVLGNVSEALRERLNSGESKPHFFDHFEGFTR